MATDFEIGRGYTLIYAKIDKKALDKSAMDASKSAAAKAGSSFSTEFSKRLKVDNKAVKAVATSLGDALGSATGVAAGAQFSSTFQQGIKDSTAGVRKESAKLGAEVSKSMAAKIVDGYEAAISAKFAKIRDRVSKVQDSITEKSRKAGNSILNGLTGGNADKVSGSLGKVFGKLEMFGKVGAEIGSRLTSGIGSALAATGPVVQTALVAALVAAVGQAAVVVGPMIGGLIGAALISQVAIAGIVAGIKGAANSPKVKDAWGDFAEGAKAMFLRATSSFVAPVVDSLDIFTKAFGPMETKLTKIFSNLAPSVEGLAESAVAFTDGLLGGIESVSKIAKPFLDRLGKGLERIGENIGEALSAFADNEDAINGAYMAFDLFLSAIENGLPLAIDLVGWLSEKFLDMMDFLNSNIKGLANFARALGMDGVADKLDTASDSISDLRTRTSQATRSTELWADATKTQTAATDALTTALGKELEAQTKLLNQNLSAEQSRLSAIKSNQEFNKFLKETTKGFDENTKAGFKNREELNSYVSEQTGYIATQQKAIAETKGLTEANKFASVEFQKLRDKTVEAGIQMGLSKTKAEEYADKILQIPSSKTTTFNTPGLQAGIDGAVNLYNRIKDLPEDHMLNFEVNGYDDAIRKLKELRIKQIALASGNSETKVRTELDKNPAAYSPFKFASGGFVEGKGTTTSDSIPAWLSDKEYVIKARAVQKYGKSFFDMLNTGQVNQNAIAKYAAGGQVNVPMPVDVSKTKMPVLDLAGLTGGSGPMGGQGGSGWTALWNALKSAVPSARLYSSVRPGDRTPYGNTSYHSSGRAIDVNPSQANFNFLHDTFGKNLKELIWGGDFRRNINNGRYYKYDDFLLRQHGPYQGRSWGNDHIHAAMDNGGVLPPKSTTMVTNATSESELALTMDKAKELAGDTYNVTLMVQPQDIDTAQKLTDLLDSMSSSQSKRVL